jgi:serine phosphatase RsbU (regulator of sigma subunit)
VNQGHPELLRRILAFMVGIGADPADDEYTRTIKRIYWVTAAFGVVASFGSTLLYFLSGETLLGWLFLASFLLFSGLYVDGIIHPKHFRAITMAVLLYFVVASVLVTVLRGGIWVTDGTIMIGLMGPLLGLVYFRDRRLAVALFLVYSACILGLAALEPGQIRLSAAGLKLSTFTFWLGFVVVAGFIFGVMYFFVVQRDKSHRQLAEEKEKSERLLRRIEADLAQAARIQKDLLPKEGLRVDGFDIAGLNVPCYEIGGDYYDFVRIDPDRLGVVIADVSGKGISASLLMASLRAALLAEVSPDYDLGRMASRLSDFVYKSSGPTSFITFFFGEIDQRTTDLRYVNAGHNPPFILSGDGRAHSLGSSGFPLGMFAGAAYEIRAARLAPGDLAVLFTDGIPEGRNAQGKDYSEDKLMAVVRENRAAAAADICRTVVGDVRGYASGSQPCDDITLVVVKRMLNPELT